MSDFLKGNPFDGQSPFEWERQVICYCKERIVTTRRHPSADRYVVCSRECWDRMVDDGNYESGSLYREWKGPRDTSFYTS